MASIPKILCLYSGGLDSAGALWKIINDESYSNHQILIHHVHILNATGRYFAENQAVEQTIPLFRKYTHHQLYYSSTIMDFKFLAPWVPIDADVYGFVAANLANIDLSIEVIVIGRTLDDKNSGGDSNIQIVDCVERELYLNKLGRQNYSSAKCLTPVVDLTKQQIWEILPDDIRNSTWSCRRPHYQSLDNQQTIAQPCGSCHACIARQRLVENGFS